jgi:hypothetical protein
MGGPGSERKGHRTARRGRKFTNRLYGHYKKARKHEFRSSGFNRSRARYLAGYTRHIYGGGPKPE